MRLELFRRRGWKCEVCGKHLLDEGSTAQLAHIIPKTKRNIIKYGNEIIHHPLNLVAVCSLKCNSKTLIGNSPIAEYELIERIKESIKREKENASKKN
jgi:hypothetical protein